jgi:hypothetical protein
MPSISQEYVHHFIRGFIDGDGHIRKTALQITSSAPILDDLYQWFELIGVPTKICLSIHMTSIHHDFGSHPKLHLILLCLIYIRTQHCI